jgi:hypothetical protein
MNAGLHRFWINPQTKQHDPALRFHNGPALAVEISVPDDYANALTLLSKPISSIADRISTNRC